MKNLSYKQTLAIGIIFAVIGYSIMNKSAVGSWLAVIGDVFIVASIVILIKDRKHKKQV